MRLAEHSVRMTNPESGERHGGEDGLLFYSAEAGAERVLNAIAGKALIVSDEDTLSVFAGLAGLPRAIMLVFDGDVLPLFSMPDTVSCVLASGGKKTLRAARYFAEVRGIPCTLFPAHAALDGAFELHGEVVLGKERVTVPLRKGEVVCDFDLLSPTLGSAYARLLLSALCKPETDALRAFGMKSAEASAPDLNVESIEGILQENARQRQAERDGAPTGEGVVLSELLRAQGERVPEWRAFLQLSALYAAFFEKGKPRRYFTPDYRKRAERAGTEYTLSGVPSQEEYVIRAMTLERIRGGLAREILALLAKKGEFYKKLSQWEKDLSLRGGELQALQILPEHARGGLSAVIRDFGLMEWEISPKAV